MPDSPDQPPTTALNLTCPYCARSFADADGRYNHARVKHKGMPLKAIFPDNVKLQMRAHAKEQRRLAKVERDREPSLADIAIEATWKRAAGLPLDVLEESLLP